MSAALLHGAARVADHGDHQRAALSGLVHGPEHKGRAPAGRNADHAVLRRDVEVDHGRSAGLPVVFGPFDRVGDGRRPPAMTPTTSSGGVLKVGGHSEASSTPSRPDVPAPT